jgi:hypothetical protein
MFDALQSNRTNSLNRVCILRAGIVSSKQRERDYPGLMFFVENFSENDFASDARTYGRTLDVARKPKHLHESISKTEPNKYEVTEIKSKRTQKGTQTVSKNQQHAYRIYRADPT